MQLLIKWGTWPSAQPGGCNSRKVKVWMRSYISLKCSTTVPLLLYFCAALRCQIWSDFFNFCPGVAVYYLQVFMLVGLGGANPAVNTPRPSRGVCVCVFFPSILDIKFVGRTSRGHTGGRSHRIFNPPSFCGACLDFCREKDSAIPFPRRPWSRILCTNELIVLHPLGIFILVF